MDHEPFSLGLGDRDWWPLTRLLLVGAAFSCFAHWRLGWTPPWRDLWALPGGLAAIFLAIVALSSSLAHVVLVAAAIPLCGIILLNDWLYDLSTATARIAFRLRSERAMNDGDFWGGSERRAHLQ